MRRRFAAHALPALLGLLACTHYGTEEAAPTGGTNDAGQANEAGPSSTPEAGTPEDAGDGGPNDAGEAACELIVKQEFDNAAAGGWISVGNGSSFAPGPEGSLALKFSVTSNGDLQRSYLERTVPYAGVRSVHSEFDIAYDEIDPDAAFGCVTNLRRSATFGEVGLGLARDSSGLEGASGFSDGTAPARSELVPLTAPDPHVWTHVTFDVSLTSDGTIDRKLDFGGQSKTMGRFAIPGSGTFDAVHVLCGVVALQGTNAIATIYLKSLTIKACRIPP